MHAHFTGDVAAAAVAGTGAGVLAGAASEAATEAGIGVCGYTA